MFKKVRFFGVRRRLNQIIDWINRHEKQSFETLRFRDETDDELTDLSDRVAALEACLSGEQVKRLKPMTEIVYAKRPRRPRQRLTTAEIIKFARALDSK